MKRTLAREAAAACGGHLVGNPEASFCGVVRDNRDAFPGCLFAAIVGEVQDGHKYLADAIFRGATVALVKEGNPYLAQLVPDDNGAFILVDDTVRAMQDLAKHYRDSFRIPFVGVTGSVGKTSTKDLCAAALSGRFRVKKTAGNYNNQIGVPLTLFGLEEDTEAAVVEMGMDHAGQIDYISTLVRPDLAVITNIGISHIENFEDREGILHAKLEIINHMNPEGTLFLCGDDPRLWKLRGTLPVRTEYYGFGEQNDARVLETALTPGGRLRVIASYRGEEYRYVLNTLGDHMAGNSLPGIMAGVHLGLTKNEIVMGLTQFVPTEKRLQLRESARYYVIDDSYNASPDSMRSALRTLEQMDRGKRHVAVLGDMFELGSQETEGHRLVGRLAAESERLELVLFVGSRMALAYDEARSAGSNCRWFESVAALEEALPALLQDGDAILVKASHGMHFDGVCSFILER